MSLKNTIQRYADVRLNERKLVGILFLQSLLLGFSTSFYFVAANTYFIKKVVIADIPYAYIVAGISGFLLVAVFKKLLKQFGSIVGFISVIILFALTCLLLYIAHNHVSENSSNALYIAYAGFIAIFPFASLFVLGFSGICLQLFNLSQSKRLLALIGTGEVIASIIGYLSVPFLLKWLGNPSYLFVLSALFIVLSIIPVLQIYLADKEKFSVNKAGSTPRKFNIALFKKEQFYLSLAVVTFFSVLAIYFTDYTYLVSVRSLASLPGSTMKVPDIVAVLFCIIKTGELIFSLFSANIISTRGMKFSLLLLPLLLLVFSVLAVAAHFIFDDVLLFVIAFFLMSKWSDRVIRKGVYAPSTKVLYQVTEPSERMQLQTSIEGTISQLSIILSGIILLVVSKSTKSNGIQGNFFYIMSFICLLFSACWFLSVFGLYTGYKKRIHQYLHTIKNIPSQIQQFSVANLFNNWLSIQHNHLSQHEVDLMQQVFAKNSIRIEQLSKNQLEQLIVSYNPSLGNMVEPDDEVTAKRIIRVYFANNNFFSRILIIWYLEITQQLKKFNLITELYEAGDFAVRNEIVAALNRLQYTPSTNERFYFTELCNHCIAEVMWAEAAIMDLADLPDATLTDMLDEHAADCKNHLLEILKILYGVKAIHIVQQVLNESGKGTESQIFAVELLDNILEPSLKQIVIPVFEPIPQQMRQSKLNKQFLIYHLPVEQRLKEILARNFKLMSVHIKQAALNNYYVITKDEEVLNAFSNSLIEGLQANADQLKNIEATPAYFLKQQLLQKLQLNTAIKQQQLNYLISDGMIADQQLKIATQVFSKKAFEHVVQIKNSDHKKIDIDVLGLALLFKMKHTETLSNTSIL